MVRNCADSQVNRIKELSINPARTLERSFVMVRLGVVADTYGLHHTVQVHYVEGVIPKTSSRSNNGHPALHVYDVESVILLDSGEVLEPEGVGTYILRRTA